MTVEAKIHGALMARLETMALTPVLPILWGPPAQRPAGEHAEVFHMPNRNIRRGLSASSPQDRQGILQISLFSVPEKGIFFRDFQQRAGQIAAHFPLDHAMTQSGVTVRVTGASVGASRPDGAHVLTIVSIEYRGAA